MDVINKVRCYKNLPKKLDILCIRISPNGTLGNYRPCYYCLKYMLKSRKNIINVYYSNSEGKIIKEKLQNMKYSVVSSGMRKNNNRNNRLIENVN